MSCCGGCFKDRHLKGEIARLSQKKGRCTFCLAEDADLVDPTELYDSLELVCGIYEHDQEGKRLIDWLIDDWALFNLERAAASDLLLHIIGDGDRMLQHYVPSALCVTDSLDVWEKLRNELRTKNRFFPETQFNKQRLADLLNHLKIEENDLPSRWFRARIEDGSGEFSPENMGAPPAKHASPGRANPVGIPYLYVGSEVKTAVTEVRPHPGETLSIAEFSLQEHLKIVDLRSPREMVNPFIMEDLEQIAEMRGNIDFLEKLGQELTTPVLPNAAAIDYIPSQYLCEFIKREGYDGVLYSSSVSSGVNLALFDPSKAQVGVVTREIVQGVQVDYESV